MSRRGIALLAVIAIAVTVAAVGSQRWRHGPDEREIREVFAAHRAAMIGKQGTDAGVLLSEASVEHFGRLKQLALNATSEELDRQRLLDRMMILLQRVSFDRERLDQMAPVDLYAWFVSVGAIGEQYAEDSDLADLTIRGEEATAEHVRGGKPVAAQGSPLRFVRERSRWKLDLRPMLDADDRGLQLLGGNDYSPQMITDAWVEILSDKRVGPETYGPMVKRGDDSSVSSGEPHGLTR